MLVSIITVCYNSEKFIKSAIESVINQTYKNIEYIIIDGGSTDNTLKIIDKYKPSISKVISEHDNGIYDAMNKGISNATGDIICFLNSDDFYINNKVVSKLVNVFESKDIDCVFADINYVSQVEPKKIVRKWETGVFRKGSFAKGWHPAHPTFVVKKDVYNKYGCFNLQFKLAADFELMLRFLEKYKISNFYLPEALINMRLGGATNKSVSNIIKGNIECLKAFKTNNIRVSFFYPILRLFPKLKQLIKK